MSPLFRRAFHAILFELIAIVVVTVGLTLFTGQAASSTGVAAIGSSVIAVAWNFVFNTIWERWEAMQSKRGRSLGRRIAHTIGFEGGLAILLTPFLAWSLDVTLIEALLYDVSFALFFLGYTFLFNFAFDRIFGLPASAR